MMRARGALTADRKTHRAAPDRFQIQRDASGSTIADQAIVVAKTLQSYGHDPEKFAADFNLELSKEPRAFMRFPAGLMADVWNRAAEICRDPHFAVRAASQIDVSFYYVLGSALRLSPSVREALQLLCAYGRVISDALAPTLTETPDTLCLTFNEHRDRSSPVVQDVTLCYVMQIVRQIDDPATRPVLVTLSRKESEYSALLLERLPCPVEFCSPNRTIQFAYEPGGAKALPPPSHYDSLLRGYVQMIASDDRQHAHLRMLLRAHLENENLSLAELAKREHVSKRTLQRLFARRRTSFSNELDSVRCEVALQRLSKDRISLTRLATELGFFDASHFSKTVKKWTGLPPRACRQLLTTSA